MKHSDYTNAVREEAPTAGSGALLPRLGRSWQIIDQGNFQPDIDGVEDRLILALLWGWFGPDLPPARLGRLAIFGGDLDGQAWGVAVDLHSWSWWVFGAAAGFAKTIAGEGPQLLGALLSGEPPDRIGGHLLDMAMTLLGTVPEDLYHLLLRAAGTEAG